MSTQEAFKAVAWNREWSIHRTLTVHMMAGFYWKSEVVGHWAKNRICRSKMLICSRHEMLFAWQFSITLMLIKRLQLNGSHKLSWTDLCVHCVPVQLQAGHILHSWHTSQNDDQIHIFPYSFISSEKQPQNNSPYWKPKREKNGCILQNFSFKCFLGKNA